MHSCDGISWALLDQVTELTWDLGIPLLIASEQFMLDRLKALCEDRIRKEIATDNVIGVFIASHRHNAAGLKEIALEYILKNLNDPAIRSGLNVSPLRQIARHLRPDVISNFCLTATQDLKSEPDLLVEIITRTSQMQWATTTTDAAPEFGNAEWTGR